MWNARCSASHISCSRLLCRPSLAPYITTSSASSNLIISSKNVEWCIKWYDLKNQHISSQIYTNLSLIFIHLHKFHLTISAQSPCNLGTRRNSSVNNSEKRSAFLNHFRNSAKPQRMKECIRTCKNRMCDILAPCWWCGKATKRGRRSTRWPGWASHYERAGWTWSFGSAARCICSWQQWQYKESKTPTRAPGCTGWPPVQEKGKIELNILIWRIKHLSAVQSWNHEG